MDIRGDKSTGFYFDEFNEEDIDRIRKKFSELSSEEYWKLHICESVTESSKEDQERMTWNWEKIKKLLDEPIFKVVSKLRTVQEHDKIHPDKMILARYLGKQFIFICDERDFHMSFNEEESALIPEYDEYMNEKLKENKK